MAGKGYVLGLRRLGGEQQGFTLVEIIAVLVLLGILAAVVAPKYMDLTDTARQKVAVGQLYEVKVRLKDGLQGYKLVNNGSLP
ncbi:MAG: prepilin-type N-terminal cleavage/methylation domain-containing protein, partial [Desulfobacteraceae bacterium]|nr:prepilin-type N-terminal cleavage/methylation domain-containing protein [Desulfobacteraceae bacterium]